MSDAYRPLFVEVPIEQIPVPRAETMAQRSLPKRWGLAYGLITAVGVVWFRGLDAGGGALVRERYDLRGYDVKFVRRCGHDASCFVSDMAVYLREAPEVIHDAFRNADLTCYCVRERLD